MVKSFVVLFLFVLLICPYLLLFKEMQITTLDFKELGEAFRNTLLQSFLSCVGTILLGFWAALGLTSLQGHRKQKYLELACLVPSFLPALFFVTAILQIIKPFPFGVTGIVLVHTLTYVGLVALFFQSVFQNKFQGLSEQAYLEGASQFQFLKAVMKNIPFEIAMISLFLFVQFFTSFSVPLLVGQQALTVETLIYEKIRTSGALSDAMAISFLESIFVMMFLLLYRAQRALANRQVYEKIHLLSAKSGLFIVLFPVVIFLMGSLTGVAMGLTQLSQSPTSFSELLPLAVRSVALSMLVGLVLVIALSLVVFTYRNRFFDKFLLSYIPLSTVLIGLSFLLVDLGVGYLESDIKVVFAMLILFLPVLYRFELKAKLSALEQQIEVASLMGSTRFLTFKKIVFPQVLPTILFLAGLGAFWTIGDFAISQIIFGKDVTLALYIQSLVGSYRLELANLFVFLLLFLGLIVFIIFKEMRHVVSQKN